MILPGTIGQFMASGRRSLLSVADIVASNNGGYPWNPITGLVYPAVGANVVKTFSYLGKTYVQVERARTNLLDVDPVDYGAWTVIGAASVTQNAGTAPDGTATADRLTFAADAADGIKAAISTIADNAVFTTPHFIKTESGTKTFRLQVLKKDGATATTGDLTATTTWQRLSQDAVNILAGATSPEVRILNGTGAAAGSVLLWCAQPEVGAFPSSPIVAAVTTRNADVLYWPAAVVPAAMRTTGFKHTWTPRWVNATYPGNPTFLFTFYKDATHHLLLYLWDAGGIKLYLSYKDGGGEVNLITTGLLTINAGDTPEIAIVPNTGDMILSGFTGGDGTYNGGAFDTKITADMKYYIGTDGRTPGTGMDFAAYSLPEAA